jgi:beta-galactosidase/beta-glucuronidase
MKILLRLNVALVLWLVFAVATAAQNIPRPEYPRPDFQRGEWQSLNGTWQFEFDDADRGLKEGWYKSSRASFSRRIEVPFAFQTKLSGINDPSYHDVVWYRRELNLPANFRIGDKRVLLNFGAVDYESVVWVNGERVGEHRGGNTPFQFDITDYLQATGNSIVVRVFDPSTDRTIPRGKQFWEPKSAAIWYTRTTGIWQPVWIETAAPVHFKRLRITPDIDNSAVRIETILNRAVSGGEKIRLTATFRGNQAAIAEISAQTQGGANPVATIHLHNQETWSPERPNLYDLRVELIAAGGGLIDRVDSYFGQRKIEARDGKVFLNNNPYYQKLVLDQGYWPESTITPPTDAAIKYDIEMAKKFGLNGARKHQKVEDPRWLYWCDKLGFLAWGEMANAFDIYTDDYISRFNEEWIEVVQRDYNHPSIIAWTPINESWGTIRIATDRQQQEHAKAMYYLIRSLDTTRLVQDNDGWEHTDTTDIFGIHDYGRGEELTEKYKILETDRSSIPRNGKEALAFGYKYNGSPIIVTEFGGIAFRLDAPKAANEFGYGNIEPTKESFLRRLDSTVSALRNNKAFVGYCYTQLTDVEQEINGLMTYDRKPKVSPEEFARIFNK